ncbi:MAG TPA: methylated-DNA--[protein]-cysteine S-methyltransferase [Vicinamibacterales bacterium]|nr:methylated-DNA--[protein]-cysteine S-methyltransferase [Vicinamibacterales bacterium]
MQLHRSIIVTPVGEMMALASDEGLCALEFVGPDERMTRLEARLQRHFPPHAIADRESPIIARARRWLDAYFAGESAEIGNVALDMRGAPFEKRVWQALTRIPPGETTSYGAIAKSLGSAGASRAVGAANGANPVSIIVPCHRVIGASGHLTGYGGGLDRKTWLLNHEKRWSRVPQAALF